MTSIIIFAYTLLSIMVNFCAVYGCANRGKRDNKSFYRLPAVLNKGCERTKELSRQRREKWLAHISRDIKPHNLPFTRVCSDHFVSGKPSSLFDFSNPDWAPTLNLGHKKVKIAASEDVNRHNRLVIRKERNRTQHAAAAMTELQDTLIRQDHCAETECDAVSDGAMSTQTELTGNSVVAMQQELQRLTEENRQMKQKLSEAHFDENFFKNDNEKVKYYTGLPDYGTLVVVYDFVKHHIQHSRLHVLCKFKQLVLVLMKLRLNSSHIDMAQKFGVNRSTSARIFLSVLDVLYVRLGPLIYWPDHEQLRETMPMCFRVNFGTKVVVIVDCFEVFIERPSNLCARAQTWSSYKHNNTVKFLIGISPQGSISFISRGWGGRASDKCVMENCGILNKILPGDIVLADRGFDIADSVAMMGGELKIPTFTRGKSQLSGKDVEKTRRIANVRIHVERVIGSLRQKYSILQSTVPLDYVATTTGTETTLDKITSVCCALTNLCPSVVPFD